MVLTKVIHLLVEMYVLSVLLTTAFHAFSFFRKAYFTKPSSSLAFKIGTFKDRLANKYVHDRPKHLYSFERRMLFRVACSYIVFAVLILSEAETEWVLAYTFALGLQSVTAILTAIGIRNRIVKMRQVLKSDLVQR